MKQCCSIYRHPLFERKKKAWHLFEAYRGAVFAEEQGCIHVLINCIIDITFFSHWRYYLILWITFAYYYVSYFILEDSL